MYMYKKDNCHAGNVKVFIDPKSGIDFFGGGRINDAKVKEGMLILDLGSYFCEPLFSCVNCKFPNLEKATTFSSKAFQPPHTGYLFINWKDGTSCDLRRHEWEAIIADIRDSHFREVLVTCMGGHGRTGTALCILAALMKIPEIDIFYNDPVKWLRAVYCEKAVESEAQIEYIQEITGLETKEKVRFRFRGVDKTVRENYYYYED